MFDRGGSHEKWRCDDNHNVVNNPDLGPRKVREVAKNVSGSR